MEGPSLYLAVEQLRPFVGKKINSVFGNTKIGKERLENQIVKDIFSWGKHLVFQFETLALRVHFLLYGSFEAVIQGKSVTGDYQRKNRQTRLELFFDDGNIKMFSCSLKYIETSNAKNEYDFSVNVLSKEWDPTKAGKKVFELRDDQIADVLLDQDIFAGVGNIIKNEVLHQAFVHPEVLVRELKQSKIKEIIKRTEDYSWDFYRWRKKFELKKHYQIYRQSLCKRCSNKVVRKTTGIRQRFSFICSVCQPIK